MTEGHRRWTTAAVQITLQQIRELQERHKQGAGYASLAQAYGMTETAVELLCDRSKRRQRIW